MSTLHPIDLRSDTVTRPTPAMRRAIAEAEVGDDVYGEDPTVNRLQDVAAERLGKEAALFVPSGSMANQAALRSLTHHGDVVLATPGAHVLRYEAGAAAALSGLQIKTIGGADGPTPADVREAIPPSDVHNAPVTVLALEITHNAAGGTILPHDVTCALVATARQCGLASHLDGARLFNAEVATEHSVADWAAPFDTVSFCLSKGLGAPVGSLVCGSRAQVAEIRRIRKMFGGGMRQAGLLAAAGLYALEHHVARLREDHHNAVRLADGWARLGLQVRPPRTNIVLIDIPEAEAFVTGARAQGVWMNAVGPSRVRALTHLDVSSADVDAAVTRLAPVVERHRATSR